MSSNQYGQLAAKLRLLKEKPAQIVELARTEIETLVKSEFAQGKDPYGRAWADKKAGGKSFLRKTGTLSGSLSVTADGTAIVITISDYKFAFHQRTRPMFPVGVMPPAWSKAIENAFARAISS